MKQQASIKICCYVLFHQICLTCRYILCKIIDYSYQSYTKDNRVLIKHVLKNISKNK